MSDLFDRLAGAVVDTVLDSDSVRYHTTSEDQPAALPPGLPALPPEPVVITRGLDAIRARDPGFDEGSLVAQARAVWFRTCGPTTPGGAGALSDAAIVAAQVGPSLETVTVRFGPAGGEEDWVFRRSSSATTASDPAAESGRCRLCGAPLRLDDAGTCPYCHATVLAAPTWALATRNQLRPMTAADVAALAVMSARADTDGPPPSLPAPPPPAAATEGLDLTAMGVDPYNLIAGARETVYAVAQARSQRHPEQVGGMVTAEFAARLGEEAASEASLHRHHVLAFLEVSDAVIVAAARTADGDQVTLRMHMTGEEYELADGSFQLAEGTQTVHSWMEEWVFTRSVGSESWLAASSVRLDGGGGVAVPAPSADGPPVSQVPAPARPPALPPVSAPPVI